VVDLYPLPPLRGVLPLDRGRAYTRRGRAVRAANSTTYTPFGQIYACRLVETINDLR
jgi:hypothetical protein